MTFEEWWDAYLYLGDDLDKELAQAAWEAALEQREAEIANLRAAIIKTLEHNLDLTDGDNCTLYDLKKSVGWD